MIGRAFHRWFILREINWKNLIQFSFYEHTSSCPSNLPSWPSFDDIWKYCKKLKVTALERYVRCVASCLVEDVVTCRSAMPLSGISPLCDDHYQIIFSTSWYSKQLSPIENNFQFEFPTSWTSLHCFDRAFWSPHRLT